MPRIPIIEQTTNVATTTPSPQAQGQQVVSPIGNAGAIAEQGLNYLAEAEVRNQNALTMKENADAVANTGKPLSDADVYWKQYLTDAPKTTVDGGMVKQDDGTTVGFREKASKDFDSWAAGFMAPITNEKAKIYAQNHINNLRTQVLDNAITFEAQAGVANRAAKVDESVGNWAKQAAGDTSPPDQLVKNVTQLVTNAKTLIANSGFDERTRNEKALAATRAIVQAANTGAMNRDPIGYKNAALAIYGIDPTIPPGKSSVTLPAADEDAITQTATSLGIAPGDLRTIISYETGGKFDPSIRGGKNNRHIGLIQFGEDEQKTYGANQQQSFAEQMVAVKKYLTDRGVRPGDDLKTLYKIVNGGNRDVPDTASDGNGTIADHVSRMQAEHGGGGSSGPRTSAASANPQLVSLVGQLPVDQLPAYISHANTLVNQQQAQLQSSVAATQADHVAAFMNGQTVPKPLSESDYTAAYGPIEGAQRFANYQQVQQLGYDITSMKAMPPEQIDALTENYRPDPAKPGFDLANRRFESIKEAAGKVKTERQSDPMAYAIAANIAGAQPIDFSNTQTFTKSVAARQGIAATMQTTFKSPYALLTTAEATTLARGFETMPTMQRMDYLQTIKSSLSDPAAYRSIMQQIAPDSPVTAMAGIILSKQQPMVVSHMIASDDVFQPQYVASLILEGESLLNPTKAGKREDGRGKEFPMPKEQDFRDQFSSSVGKAFAGDPKGADFAYQAVKAYYAGKASQDSDFSGIIDSGRLKESINAVVGGVSDGGTGKSKVVMPWGMGEGPFKDAVNRSFNAAIEANGYTDTNAAKLRNFSLQSAGDGKYVLNNGTGPLIGKDDRPIVLDLNKVPQAASAKSVPAPEIVPPASVVPEKPVKQNTQQPRTK